MNLQNLLPAKLGAEPKKLAALVGLVVVLGGVYWFNRTTSAGPETTSTAVPAAPAAIRAPALVPPASRSTSGSTARAGSGTGARGSNIADFKPTLKLAEDADVSRIDPALHLDLLARVRGVGAEGGTRSLFEFSQPPPPPPPKVKPIVPTTPTATPTAPEAPKGPPEPPKPPPPPPIALKFYGYAGTTRAGTRRAFFLDGDDILVAGENETLKNRYKIVRIGVNSAVVEDLSNQNQQTLPLVEEL
ncbi:MAG TPA: hypothetical protein VN841_07700 [Bryobacteraceae bacterium]|nr:hypothetical protein [Bryobacteraceae bacterium]